MLKTLVEKLICPTCRDLGSRLKMHVFHESGDGHVRDGVLSCEQCGIWYPIDGDMLELVPRELLYREELMLFEERFAAQLNAAGCEPQSPGIDPARYGEQIAQRDHFDRYAEGVEPGFKDYTQTPFIRAAAVRFGKLWRRRLTGRGGWVLDIGCGTGINSFPVAADHTIVGFDISRATIKKVIDRAAELGLRQNTTFLVGDGSFLAFRDQSFDYSQTFGALHHLPDPGETIVQIMRILKPGGQHFAVENNLSAFRPIFDWMMRLRPLWIEEAGTEPLISYAMVRRWAAKANAKAEIESSVFLPPHLFNVIGDSASRVMLDLTDRLSGLLPWFKRQGGQIIFVLQRPRHSPTV